MGIQHLTGKPFEPDTRSYEERVVKGLEYIAETVEIGSKMHQE